MEAVFIQRPSDLERQAIIDRTARLLKAASRDQLILALSDTALLLAHERAEIADEELAAMLALVLVAEALQNHLGK
jgi:hypothetical protein